MSKAMEIGTRRELFVDGHLLERLTGATQRLHTPVRREVVMELNEPCECSTSYYYNVFQDHDRVRLYYRGRYPEGNDRSLGQTANVAESTDGIHFTRPSLGIIEVDGSTDNNVVWIGAGGHNFHAFRDDSPSADPDQRYKAVGSAGMGKLYGFGSPDGLHWALVQENPLPIPGAFDSLNVVFWDARTGKYRLFSRYFEGEPRVRAIQSCESDDFLHWTEPIPHRYAESVPWEQFYTNATVPCPGAEHILLSFPKRLIPDRTRSTEGMVYPNEGLSDAVFMTSRDGVHWDRTFLEAWLRPGLDPRNWSHRNNLPAVGIIETAPDEWSMYIGENYGWDTNRLRRVTVRPHGFASVYAGRAGGEALTRPLVLKGSQLRINYSTSAAGFVGVELQDEAGKPLDGFTLEDMDVMFGDELDAVVSWKRGSDLTSLVGQPVRLRFALEDADVFAFRTA